MRDYWGIAAAYVDGVIAGDTPACLYVRLACERFLRDVERANEIGDIVIDADSGAGWCHFLETLPHVKGKWASRRQSIELSPWQVFVTVNVYGWKWADTGLRRFREAYVEVPRKNGKSTWVAGLGLGHLCRDGEEGAEVYTGATTEKQAWEVFRPARTMCQRRPQLVEHFGLTVNAKTLVIDATASRFEPVIGNPGDGASPSAAIADEYHEHKTADLVDTFVTGMGAREQPMMWYITTAGVDMGGPCYAKRADCIDILKNTVSDDSVFAIIYGIDEGDAWDTEEAAAKANPNYGVSVSADFLAGQLSQARRSAQKQTAYRTKHLNQWVGAKAAWMNMLAYQACRRSSLSLADFKGKSAIVSVDLASKVDVACLGILFREHDRYSAFVRHYVPESVILEGGNTRYKTWHAAGWLNATPGDVIDYGQIEDDLIDLGKEIDVLEVVFDPFQATQFATRMGEEGFAMVEYGATVKNFSEPMKELEKLILTKAIAFESDPVLTWMFGNVVARLDAKDNIFPRKERPEAKIDGPVALIMALARMLAHKGPSVYDGRGLRAIG